MKQIISTFLILLLFISCNEESNPVVFLEKGISLELATYRNQQVSNVKHQLQFNIPKTKAESISSHLKISATISNLKHDLILDFNEKKENREKESWVQSALSNIDHPLRQKSTQKHIKACLGKLEKSQLTGDTFSPKGRLSSFVRRYSSKEVYDIVQTFLNENPITIQS